jgi:hypothetical protein
MPRVKRSSVSQAWIELLAEDPEALSTLAVMRDRLGAARHLTEVRRLRVVELAGPLPSREVQADLLHRSIQFYNPHKERCTLRLGAEEAPPLRRGERVVLVTERGGERRPAAERWWLHETGAAIEVWEGVAWALTLEGDAASERAAELAVLHDRRHGLLCNPHAQEARVAGEEIPIPWMKKVRRASEGQEPR